MADLAAIAAAAASAFGGGSGVQKALDHEPEQLPRSLPAVCLLFRQVEPKDVATGPLETWAWTWRVNLYVPLSDYAASQASLALIVPRLLAAVRADRTLAGTCEQAFLVDEGREPVFAHAEGYLVKSLTLEAWTEES